jgi:hypothetical protein
VSPYDKLDIIIKVLEIIESDPQPIGRSLSEAVKSRVPTIVKNVKDDAVVGQSSRWEVRVTVISLRTPLNQ